MQSADPVWTCCGHSKLFKKCWQADVYTRRTRAGLGILCPFATNLKSELKHNVNINTLSHTLTDLMEVPFWIHSWSGSNLNFQGGLAVSRTGVQGTWHHSSSWHEQDTAGGSSSLSSNVFIIFSCFATANSSCQLSPLAIFSTNCPQDVVLLNLCENLKLRHYHSTSLLVDYLSMHRGVLAINSSAQIVALPLNKCANCLTRGEHRCGTHLSLL